MAAIPNDRLMVETDCPWCDIRATHAGRRFVVSPPPAPAKDKKKWDAGAMVKGRNEPCAIVQVFEVVAGARGVAEGPARDALAERIYDNTHAMFFSAPRLTQLLDASGGGA